MPTNNQFALFVDDADLFQTYFRVHPEDLHGTLNLQVRDSRKVAVVGLIQKRATGALIAVATGGKGFTR